MIPSHTPVIINAPKKYAGQSGHVVAFEDNTDPKTVDIKLDSSGEIVTVQADQVQVLG